jgi:hypothetical protein
MTETEKQKIYQEIFEKSIKQVPKIELPEDDDLYAQEIVKRRLVIIPDNLKKLM